MSQFFAIINHWVHLMSAVIWIGGLAFLVMSVTPALRKVVPKEYLRPVLDAISTRYRKIVGILMAVILMTGGINLHFISQMMLSQTGSGISNSPKYLTILFIKLTLVLGIVTLFLYTFIFKVSPPPKTRKKNWKPFRSNASPSGWASSSSSAPPR